MERHLSGGFFVRSWVDACGLTAARGTRYHVRAMSVRFQCNHCTQPIEVDDEWASKMVACPYCRNTITAPSESTLTELRQVPTATPLTEAYGVPPHPAGPPGEPEAPSASPSNRIALIAFGLACGMLVLLVCQVGVATTHSAEIDDLVQSSERTSPMQAALEYVDSHGGRFPGWYLALSLLTMGIGVLWIATVICGVVAVRHPRRRRFAIAALAMASVIPVVLCCGGLLGAGA